MAGLAWKHGVRAMLGALRLLVFAAAMIAALPCAATTVPAKGGSAAGTRTGDPTGTGQAGGGDPVTGQNGGAGPTLKGSYGDIPTAPVPNTPNTAVSQASTTTTDSTANENTENPSAADAQADALLEQYAADENLVDDLPIMKKMRHARE